MKTLEIKKNWYIDKWTLMKISYLSDDAKFDFFF